MDLIHQKVLESWIKITPACRWPLQTELLTVLIHQKVLEIWIKITFSCHGPL